MEALAARLDDSFARAVDLILACSGRAVVSGIGKSGHVARKIASTLASTGTPAFFLHPAEASHGDLGMITAQDVMIALSNSGESAELLAIVPLVKRRGAALIADDRQPALRARAGGRRAPGRRRGGGSLPAGPGSHGQHHRRAGSGRCAGCRAARSARLRRRGLSRARTRAASLGRRLLTHVSDVMRTG